MKCSHINKVDAAYYHKRAVNLDVPEIPHFYPCHVCEGVEDEVVSVEFINEKRKGNSRQTTSKYNNNSNCPELTAEERVKALRNLYARAREKIKAAGGMKTTQQVIEEI